MKKKFKVSEALRKDVGRAFARIDPVDMESLDLKIGDIIEIIGKKKTLAKLMPTFKDYRGKSRIQIDGVTRENARVGIDETVSINKINSKSAIKVVLTPLNFLITKQDLKYIGSLLDGLPVLKDSKIRVNLFSGRAVDLVVEETIPKGPVIISIATSLLINTSKNENKENKTSYEDIGGLKNQVYKIREMVELPLRFPEIFKKLGIDPPKGVLLFGPPGCGKTLIARAIAHETEANFFSINGPEIIQKFYGESEAHLRKIFEDASKKAPSIIFLDEIDAIAPKREKVFGDVEKRVVAQLLGLMDGLNKRQNVIVIAATNIPNSIDPALRRPGRFDREISIAIPDSNGRLEILEIHSRGMPLSEDVDLLHLAKTTHGFVGADIEALCREAAMSCLRRIMPDIDFSLSTVPYDILSKLEVQMNDFQEALKEIEPSAIREVFVEIPNVKWDDIGGLNETKNALKEAIEWPLKYSKLFKKINIKPPKGILLVGPPGCGKTLLAKACANESEVNFISIKGPALMSKYVGESEKGIRDIFRKARQASPCIIFFDEIDSLIPTRSGISSDSHVSERVLSQFLVELDGIEELKNVLVLAATNRIDMLDNAVLRPGRFDKIIKIELPNKEGKMSIYNVHLKNKPLEKDIDYEGLVDLSVEFSGSDIASVCYKASLKAIKKVIDKNNKIKDLLITYKDLKESINEIIIEHKNVQN